MFYRVRRFSQYHAKGRCLSASFASCCLRARTISRSSLMSSPLGAIRTFPLIRHPFHAGDMGVRSSPLWIIISFLHSGGIGFPASQPVIVLTVLQQSSAVFSLDNPHVNHLKISFSCMLRFITFNPCKRAFILICCNSLFFNVTMVRRISFDRFGAI